MTGNDFVDAISEMHFEGNVIPASWYQALRFPNGKADLNAIIILSEIVYWYRATEERDEATGELRGWRQRFKADLLQRSYQSFAAQFGLTKRQVQEACTRLARVYRAIRLVFRTIDTPTGRLANVLFIAPVPEKIRAITHQRDRSHIQTGHPSHSNGTPLTSQCETNTEITTKITTEKGERERTPTPAQEVKIPAPEMPRQDPPTTSLPAPVIRVPEGWQPSAETEAFLKERYPMLNFAEEMLRIRDTDFRSPKSDWNALTRKWFSQEAEKRDWRQKSATADLAGSGGDWRRDATNTDKRTRDLLRQRQALHDLTEPLARAPETTALTVSYEDISYVGQ